MNKLDRLHADLAEAHAALAPAGAALDRARAVVAEKTQALSALEAQHEAAIAAQAQRLAAGIASGDSAHDCAPDAHCAAALTSAFHESRVAKAAAASLAQRFTERQVAVVSAQSAIVAEVDSQLNEEITQQARALERHLNAAARQGLALKYFCVAAGFQSTAAVSDIVLRVLERLDLPLLDMKEVPVNLQKLGDIEAFRAWSARRSALIAGNAAEEAAAA